MVHINLKSAAKSAMDYAVDISVVDLPRVNAVMQQLVVSEIPESGPLEEQLEPPEYPADVIALGLPEAPRLFGELSFRTCPGTKRTLVIGTLTGQIPMRCQSCLAPFINQLNVDVKLCHIYAEEQEPLVPDGYDSLIFDRQDLTLGELLEDDILLTLPSFPRHAQGLCKGVLKPAERLASVEKKPSPFATLKELLQDGQ